MSIDPSHIRALIRKAVADHSYYVSTRTTLPSSELDSYTNQKRDRALDDVVATLQAQYDEQWRELEKVSVVSATSDCKNYHPAFSQNTEPWHLGVCSCPSCKAS